MKIFRFFSCLFTIFQKSKPIDSLKHILALQTWGLKSATFCTCKNNNHIHLTIYSWNNEYIWTFLIPELDICHFYKKDSVDLNHCGMKMFSRNDHFMKYIENKINSFIFIVVQQSCNSNTIFFFFFCNCAFWSLFYKESCKKAKN